MLILNNLIMNSCSSLILLTKISENIIRNYLFLQNFVHFRRNLIEIQCLLQYISNIMKKSDTQTYHTVEQVGHWCQGPILLMLIDSSITDNRTFSFESLLVAEKSVRPEVYSDRPTVRTPLKEKVQ